MQPSTKWDWLVWELDHLIFPALITGLRKRLFSKPPRSCALVACLPAFWGVCVCVRGARLVILDAAHSLELTESDSALPLHGSASCYPPSAILSPSLFEHHSKVFDVRHCFILELNGRLENIKGIWSWIDSLNAAGLFLTFKIWIFDMYAIRNIYHAFICMLSIWTVHFVLWSKAPNMEACCG